jgi:WD40 repeat protein
MAFSLDGRWLFVGTVSGLWQLPLREDGPPRKLISERPVWSLALSSDGALLAAGSFAGEIHLIRASDGTSLRTLRGHEGAGAVVALAFSPDGRLLASGAEDGTIFLWGAR